MPFRLLAAFACTFPPTYTLLCPENAMSMCARAKSSYDHTLPEFLRLRSYSHLLFSPTLILFPPGGLGVAGGSENTLELNEVVLAFHDPVLAFNVLVLRVFCEPCEEDRLGL